MGRTNDLYEHVENLVYVALESGANTTSDVYGYVTQYVPKSLVSYQLIENIIEDSYGKPEDYEQRGC